MISSSTSCSGTVASSTPLSFPSEGAERPTIDRDDKTGRLITKEQAERRNPATVTKEQMPNPGRGDTK